MSEKSIMAMEKALTPIAGEEILSRCVKVVRGIVLPRRYYYEGFYTWKGNNLFADAIIEYQDGRRHTLIKNYNQLNC